MKRHIVFSDIDGTLLTSTRSISPLTMQASTSLRNTQIPFVIVSARSPSAIYPILREYDFNCPIISYSGSLMLDADRNVLYDAGMTKEYAAKIIQFVKNRQFDLSWSAFSMDEWLVEDTDDPRIIREEYYVKARAKRGTVNALEDGANVNKILCICNPGHILEIEQEIGAAFPDCSIAKSSDILLEIMGKGITKAHAVHRLCSMWGYDIKDAIAFGDNYNDEEMLKAVGYGFLMENAPHALKERIANHTLDNDHDGIYHALKKMNLIKD